jgi:DNA-binding NarL/FixJ family response regulator
MLSVLIVDDDACFRDGVKRLFEDECDFRVAGEAEDGIDAVEKAINLKPNLIILDFYLPVLNGLAAAPALRAHLPDVTIIMLTLFSGGQLAICARKAGMQALVAKHEAAAVLIPTARSLFAEKSILAQRR